MLGKDTSEVVCEFGNCGIISGGGFSAYLSRPQYQSSVVNDYFETLGEGNQPYPGFGRGRGYPDLSLLGTGYSIYNAHTQTVVAGTSASTPVVAAMITLINDARLNNGLSTLGWIHPSLYQNYASFTNDITSGKNNCPRRASEPCCPTGFFAARGWDPTTGLGSVNFKKFYDFYISAAGKILILNF